MTLVIIQGGIANMIVMPLKPGDLVFIPTNFAVFNYISSTNSHFN